MKRFCVLENAEFDRVYKVLRRSENMLRKPSLGNAFLIISESIFVFWLQKSSFSTGFIRVFATRFWFLRNLVFQWFYKAFRHGGMSCGIYL